MSGCPPRRSSGRWIAPLSVVAKEPSGDPAALQPAPQASSSPSPAADSAVDVTPTPAPAAPTPAPTDEPAPTPTRSSPSQAPPAEPSVQPMATPSRAPSVAPSVTPSVAPPGEATPPAAEATTPAAGATSPSPEASASGDTGDYVVTFAPGNRTPSQRASILCRGRRRRRRLDRAAAHGRRPGAGRARASSTHCVRATRTCSASSRDRVRAAEATPDDPGYDEPVVAAAHRLGRRLRRRAPDGLGGRRRPRHRRRRRPAGPRRAAGRRHRASSPGSDSDARPERPRHRDGGHHRRRRRTTVAAIAGIGFAGVKVMPVTVLDANGLGQDSDIIEGIVWAVDHGADVINLSFSNPGYSAALQAAIDYAWDHDVVVVAATGNDGSERADLSGRRSRRHRRLEHGPVRRARRLLERRRRHVPRRARAPTSSTLRAGGGTTTVTGTSASSAEVAARPRCCARSIPAASNGVIVGRLARSAAAVGTRAETGNGRLDLAARSPTPAPTPIKPAAPRRPATAVRSSGPYVDRRGDGQRDLDPERLGRHRSRVAPGASITLVMSVTTTGVGAAADWDSSRWAFATVAPAAAAMTCVDHPEPHRPRHLHRDLHDHGAGRGRDVQPVPVRLQQRRLRVRPERAVHAGERARQRRPDRHDQPGRRPGRPDQRRARSTSRSSSARPSSASRPAT